MVSGRTHVAALLLLTGTMLGWSASVSAQASPRPERRGYVELLGAGGLFSVNFERDMTRDVGIRLGGGAVPIPGPRYLVGLAGLTWRVGEDLRALHVGAGLGLGGPGLWANEKNVYAYGSLAFNFQARSPGGFMRVAFTPLLIHDRWIPSFGLGMGWAF
jgi:hypothetical protein